MPGATSTAGTATETGTQKGPLCRATAALLKRAAGSRTHITRHPTAARRISPGLPCATICAMSSSFGDVSEAVFSVAEHRRAERTSGRDGLRAGRSALPRAMLMLAFLFAKEHLSAADAAAERSLAIAGVCGPVELLLARNDNVQCRFYCRRMNCLYMPLL